METEFNLQERYFAGDDDIERCILCNEIHYCNEMTKVENEWYCGCNIEDEDTATLVREAKAYRKELIRKANNMSNIHPLFQSILNTYKPKSL